VSSEEDASMALQVSNALTQALLQFRMNNLPQGVSLKGPEDKNYVPVPLDVTLIGNFPILVGQVTH